MTVAQHIRTLATSVGLATLLSLASSTQAVEVQLPLEQADSGNLYLDARLDDMVDTALLFDTGSGYVSLSRKTFSQVESETGTTLARHIHGRMADGSTVSVPVYTIRELRLGQCLLHDVEVVVFPDADRDILGLNAIRQLQPFTVKLDPPVLSASC